MRNVGTLVGILCAAVLAAGLTAPDARALDKKERKLKAGDRDPAFLGRVNGAIERGVDFLLSKQDEDGHWPSYFDEFLNGPFTKGVTALCLFALLKSGVNRNDAQIKKGFDYLRKKWQEWCDFGQPLPPQKDAWHTYDVGTTILALEALYRAPAKRQVGLRKDLTVVVAPRRKARLMKQDHTWMRQLVAFLQHHLGITTKTLSSDGTSTEERTTWSYPLDNPNHSADRSNTQFAVLGLSAAARCGIPTDEKIWHKVLQNFISYQQKKPEARVPREVMVEDKKHGYVTYRSISRKLDEARGWSYYTGMLPDINGDEWHKPTGSITCIGISVVLIAMEELRKLGKLKPGERSSGTRAAWDGLAWINHHFTVEKNPCHTNEKKWVYYYLYGLERSCVLAGIRNVGRHDWYREGAEFLLKMQTGQGLWCGEGDATICATCFALLFLTKATTPGFVKISGN
jgi:hypothetical protein